MNSWIIYDDYTAERMDFKTDASLRRYCMQKKARMGWRKIESGEHKGFLAPVYPAQHRLRGNLVLEDDEASLYLGNDGGEE
tara:strand:+ start:16 stop:258 length:243 start_codon:yes stop_codon:yes gene_type:complete